MRTANWGSRLGTMALAGWLAGCSVGPVAPSSAPGAPPLMLGRAQRLQQDGVTVHVAIAADDDMSAFFGVPLARHGLQPIWVRIQNDSDVGYWLLPVAIDPDYYSADEAAMLTAPGHSDADRERIRQRFRANALPFFAKPKSVQEGYVYATHARGGRFVDIRLSGHLRSVRMRFAVLLPTQGFDYEGSALRQVYRRLSDLPDLTVAQLREALRGLPCCTSRQDGSGLGDPLNVVLVGSGEDVVTSLSASGWTFTEAITIESIGRMIGAAVADAPFRTAPISSLYAFGRAQDIALQRSRATISQRNHMRLWLAPFRCEGQAVWVGQVSRDIGVKLTTKSPTLTTHVIDPVVDEAREYLFQSLLNRDAVGRFAFVRGVMQAGPGDARMNLTDDPYLTDGMRLVVWLSTTRVPPDRAIDLGWNDSADPVTEGLGRSSLVPALTGP